MAGGIVAGWVLGESFYGAASVLLFLVPFVVVALASMVYAAWRGGPAAGVFVLAPLAVDVFLLMVLPFPFGFIAVVLLIPLIAALSNLATLRRVLRSTVVAGDWPVLTEQVEAVLGELSAYGFVPVAATEWSLRRPPVNTLLLVNTTAASYADITWPPGKGPVSFTVVSELHRGGTLITGRSGQFATAAHELRQVLPGHVASQLVWFHLSALEYLASRGVMAEPASFERALPRWVEAFETDKQRIKANSVAMAWGAAWRGLLRRVLDTGPLWSHPDIEQKLAAFATATQQATEGNAARRPWSG